jgi:hypothetical protein
MASGLSLHVGVNRVDAAHYAGWEGPLTACEADADDMSALARAQGFTARKLLTREATREAVRAHIGDAASSLRRGDFFLLTYSGHGGQLPDRNGDEPDLMDETWCLFDGELVDDELHQLWMSFADGVRIFVLSDSCHSGSVTRVALTSHANHVMAESGLLPPSFEKPVYRFMPDEIALRTYRANREFYDQLAKDVPPERGVPRATVRLFSGCQDNQLSLDGTFNGLFTANLLRVWNDGRFRGDYARFHRAILDRMPATQSPNHFVIGAPNPAFDVEEPFTIEPPPRGRA